MHAAPRLRAIPSLSWRPPIGSPRRAIRFSPSTRRTNEARQVRLALLQVGQVEIHHVAGGVVVDGDVAAQFRRQVEVVEGVAYRVVGRSQVAVAAGDVYLE